VKSVPHPFRGEAGTDAEDREDALMERGWIETIRLLGLDVVLVVTVGLAVLDWAYRRMGLALARRASARQATRGAAHAPARVGEPQRSGAGQPEITWPPTAWRASH
jgi:hypothetical protein